MERLNKLYKEDGIYCMMVIGYLLQVGFDTAREFTDEDIAEVKANTSKKSVITPELNEYIMTNAREVAKEITEVQLMKWVQVNKPYDTKGVKKA